MKMQHSLKTLSALILGLGTMGIAHGAGFQLLEQNASGLGSAGPRSSSWSMASATRAAVPPSRDRNHSSTSSTSTTDQVTHSL